MSGFESLPTSGNPFESDLVAAEQDEELFYLQQLDHPTQWSPATQVALSNITPPSSLGHRAHKQLKPAEHIDPPINFGEEMEKKFVVTFAETVAQISIADTAVVDSSKTHIAHLSDYRFTPLYPARRFTGSTLTSPMKFFDMPGNVRTHYGKEGGLPYLDAKYGVGLVYRDVLTAVAAGGVDTQTGALRIKQIQGVNTWQDPNGGRGARFKTGLHNGMAWRDTLVAAWVQVATALEAPSLEIQGAANNTWINRVGTESLKNSYDRVAERNGFTYDPATQNWKRAISAQNTDLLAPSVLLQLLRPHPSDEPHSEQ